MRLELSLPRKMSNFKIHISSYQLRRIWVAFEQQLFLAGRIFLLGQRCGYLPVWATNDGLKGGARSLWFHDWQRKCRGCQRFWEARHWTLVKLEMYWSMFVWPHGITGGHDSTVCLHVTLFGLISWPPRLSEHFFQITSLWHDRLHAFQFNKMIPPWQGVKIVTPWPIFYLEQNSACRWQRTLR